MAKQFDLNPISRLRKKIFFSSWMKRLVNTSNWKKNAMVQVIEFVEDERTFINMSFMNNKLWNGFILHLDFNFVRMLQNFVCEICSHGSGVGIQCWKVGWRLCLLYGLGARLPCCNGENLAWSLVFEVPVVVFSLLFLLLRREKERWVRFALMV